MSEKTPTSPQSTHVASSGAESPAVPKRTLSKRATIAFRALAVPLVIAIVPVFALFAQGQIKEIAERFLADCSFVINKAITPEGHLLVTGWLAGQPPKNLPLVFEGRDASVNSIIFDQPYRQNLEPEPADLAFHPLTGSTCPGNLCRTAGNSTENGLLAVTLTDLHANFVYRFRVRLKPFEDGAKTVGSHLKVYSIFDQGLAGGVCRVQSQRWSNFWIWAEAWQKVALFLVVIVLASLLMKFSSAKETPP